jgi:hypothetical protein
MSLRLSFCDRVLAILVRVNKKCRTGMKLILRRIAIKSAIEFATPNARPTGLFACFSTRQFVPAPPARTLAVTILCRSAGIVTAMPNAGLQGFQRMRRRKNGTTQEVRKSCLFLYSHRWIEILQRPLRGHRGQNRSALRMRTLQLPRGSHERLKFELDFRIRKNIYRLDQQPFRLPILVRENGNLKGLSFRLYATPILAQVVAIRSDTLAPRAPGLARGLAVPASASAPRRHSTAARAATAAPGTQQTAIYAQATHNPPCRRPVRLRSRKTQIVRIREI